MPDDVSCLVGIEGLVSAEVAVLENRLELLVELAARAGLLSVVRAGCCRWCGRAVVGGAGARRWWSKERPVVRVRDLPVSGRATVLCWRKRRYHDRHLADPPKKRRARSCHPAGGAA